MPKITALPVVSTPTTTDVVPVVTAGVTSRVTTGSLLDAMTGFTPSGTGATPRTVRSKLRDTVSVMDFGATGDGVTDDAPAFQAAIDALYGKAGTLLVPRATVRYRLASRLVVKDTIHIVGDGAEANPGIVSGVTYTGLNIYRGSVICVDAGVGGLIAYDCTDVDIGTFLAGSNAVKFKYHGSRKSSMRDILWVNADLGAAADSSAHGIEIRSIWHLKNVTVIGFNGDGIRIDATADSGTTDPYGNASGATLENCKTRSNSGSGVRINGRDANVIKIDSHDSALNGAWGFNDTAFLGNTYVNCHSATNNQKLTADADQYVGSFRCTSGVAANVYSGCYVESGRGIEARLAVLCKVDGGNLGSGNATASGSRIFSDSETAYVELTGVAYRAPRRHISKKGTTAVGCRMGNNDTNMSTFAFGDLTSNADGLYQDWQLKFNNTGTNGWWGWERANSPSNTAAMIPSTGASARVNAWAFPAGFYLNGPGFGGTSPLIDSGTTARTLDANSIRGDFRFNRGTTTDGIIGWRAMIGGASGVNMTIALPGDQSGPATLTDADATLTPMTSKVREVLRVPLTADRTLTLSTTNAFAGAEFKVTRAAASTGAFNLSVGGLKNLATGQWCVVGYTGSAWELLEYGTL